MIRPILAALAAVLLAAAPAAAQIPGLRDAAGGLLGRVPSLSSFLEGDPPITTSLDDARTEIAFLDDWSPAGWERLDALARTSEGAFRLRPGRFAMEAESYCMHAGTHGPGGGDGYLYAPLAGAKAGIVQSLLRNSVAHPEVPQRDIQTLIWAIIARTEFDEMPREMQRTARTLLTRDQVDDLDDGALGMVPESVMREAMSQLPPLARQVFEAEARLRSMISSGSSSFADLERIAVLTGAVEPPEGSRPVPGGRWSFDPDGYFVRYDPSGYSRTRVEVSVPAPVAIARDASGRMVAVYGAYGQRVDLAGGGLRLLGPGGTSETILNSAPSPSAAGGGAAAAVLGVVRGNGGVPPEALRDLAEIEGLARAVRAGGTAVGDGVSAPGGAANFPVPRANALDLLVEAWQATFCLAAGCPTTPGGGEDVLVLRSGGVVRGSLGWCIERTCALGGTHFPTEAIEWIGLARADANPPAPRNPNAGEVHLDGGTVETGNLRSLGDRLAVTDVGSHLRLDVAWIHLVPGEEEETDPRTELALDNDPPPSEDGPPEEADDDDDGDEEDDDGGGVGNGGFGGPVYDPSDDVATPGNRARQRLAQSGRSSGDSPDEEEEEDCAEERREYERLSDQMDADLEVLNDLLHRFFDATGSDDWPEEGYTGPGEDLSEEWLQKDRELDELELRLQAALDRWRECDP